MASRDEASLQDIQALAEFRYNIRRFLRASEEILRAEGLKPQQYLLLLAIKGLPDGTSATISQVAERLQLQHHSTVELIGRSVRQGLVERSRGTTDRRQVFVALTPHGEALLRDLSLHHRRELRSAGPALVRALRALIDDVDTSIPLGAARDAGTDAPPPMN